MKKWLFFGVIFTLIAALMAGCGKSSSGSESDGTLGKIKDRGKFVVGVKYDTYLFGYKDPQSGKVEGFDVDIAKALAKKILGDEKKIELVEITSKTRIPMLKNGDIDAIIATMTITEERKQEVDFSDVYFDAGQSLLVKKGSAIKSVDDLKKGTKVLAVKGATSGANVKKAAPETELLEFENYAEAFTALKSGKGDALTTDNSILYGMAAQDSDYEVVGGTFTEEPYGIAMTKGDKEFVDYVNKFLKELKDSGEYDKMKAKWIKE
ncbi:transporter substrate-binding domain-containing protein [Neobacillus vireti]|uniref:Family 3 extracellular solute-binding protein n=1 Tax=Neobacillus vireti LMG 21834 TaxID=1131730 RepID=A0AB94ILU8_9BACI|nr:transporter substrate-binding domain-containing protein [Neobacillus vireti]ETI68035.1 family 3 extracellular solute-binding protein [Neobacillus vireti LMG 21834]KLT18325.1 amino acid ABC transporter substrate-binding protein [Neobacillus vireti]